MRRFSKREKRISILCLSVLFAYVFFNLIIKPVKSEIEMVEAQIESQQRRISRNIREIKKARAVSQRYDQYIKKFRQVKTNEQVMTAILSEIESVAGDLNLQISDLKPKRVKPEEYTNRFSVSLTINSQLKDIIEFIHVLQGEGHLFDVEELRFDKGSRRNSNSIKTLLVLSKILIP